MKHHALVKCNGEVAALPFAGHVLLLGLLLLPCLLLLVLELPVPQQRPHTSPQQHCVCLALVPADRALVGSQRGAAVGAVLPSSCALNDAWLCVGGSGSMSGRAWVDAVSVGACSDECICCCTVCKREQQLLHQGMQARMEGGELPTEEIMWPRSAATSSGKLPGAFSSSS